MEGGQPSIPKLITEGHDIRLTPVNPFIAFLAPVPGPLLSCFRLSLACFEFTLGSGTACAAVEALRFRGIFTFSPT